MNQRSIPSGRCRVHPVGSRSDLRDFKRLPHRIRGQEPAWVPPLKLMQSSLLNRRHHPFYDGGRSAEAEFFLARGPHGKPAGRIAAIINHRYSAHARNCNGEGEASGFFGFFDCVNSPEVARSLVAAAEDWLQRRGVTEMLGPASPSQTYEYGLLTEGRDQPHRFLLAYQPAYYADLLERSGLRKAKDLLGLSVDLHRPEMKEMIDRFFDFVDAAGRRTPGDITVRSPDIRNFDAEVRTVCRLFNQVLAQLWGHCPISEEELGQLAWSLRRLAMPDALVIGEHRGEPVGLGIAVPDLNEIIRRLRLRMSLLEPIELFLRARRWRPACMRMLVLGVRPGYERSLVVPALVAQLGRNFLSRGIRHVDAHLVVEDNSLIMVPLLRYGFRPDRRYRIYRSELSSPGT